MKKFLSALFSILILALLAVLAVPSFIDWNGHKERLADLVRSTTGRDLVISGDIHLNLLPTPVFSAGNVTLSNLPEAETAEMLQLKAVRADLALLPLLAGRIEAESLTLVGPELDLEVTAEGRANWHFPALAGSEDVLTGGAPVQLKDVRIEDGTIILRNARHGLERQIAGVQARIIAGADAGQFRGQATFEIAGTPIAIIAQIGSPDRDARSTAQVDILIEKAAEITLSGVITGHGIGEGTLDPHFEGRARLASENLASAIDTVGNILGIVRHAPEGFGRPARIEGMLVADLDALTFNRIEVDLDGERATAELDARFGAEPTLNASIEFHRIDANRWIGTRGIPADPSEAKASVPTFLDALTHRAVGLPGNLTLDLDLSGDALEIGDGRMRQVRLRVHGQEDTFQIKQALAQLPGATDFAFTGELSGRGQERIFTGTVDIASDNPRGLADWIGIPPSLMPVQRLWFAALKSDVAGDANGLRFTQTDLRLGSSRITGAATFATGPRLSFGITAHADRLVLDDYVNDLSFDVLRRHIASFDANIRAEIDEISYDGRVGQNALVDATVHDGKLALRQIALADFAGVALDLTGSIDSKDPVSGAMTLSLETLETSSLTDLIPADWLSLADPEAPPLDFRRIGALAVNVTAVGDRGRFSLDGEAELLDGRIRAEGVIAPDSDRFDIALAVDLPHPGPLIATLASRREWSSLDWGNARLDGQITGSATAVSFDLEGDLAAGSALLVGEVGAEPDGPIAVSGTLSHPDLANFLRRITGEEELPIMPPERPFSFSLQAGGRRDQPTLRLRDGKLGTTDFAASLEGTPSSPRLAVELGTLDLDEWGLLAANGWSRFWKDKVAPMLGAIQPLDILVTADRVRIGPVTADGLNAQFRLTDDMAALDHVGARINGGTATLTGSLAWAGDTGSTLSFELLNSGLSGQDWLTASTLSLTGDLTRSVDSAGDHFGGFSGTIRLVAEDGRLGGIDLDAISQGIAETSRPSVLPRTLREVMLLGATDFSWLSADIDLTADRILAKQIDILSPAGTVRGDIAYLPNSHSIDATMTIDPAAPDEAVPFTARLVGPAAAPRISLDIEALQAALLHARPPSISSSARSGSIGTSAN